MDDRGTDEILRLERDGLEVSGEVALHVAPGTVAAVRDRALEALLSKPLEALAEEKDAVLVVAASGYAFPQPGKDGQGRTRFIVSGRIEGGRLMPKKIVVEPKKKRG